ncbi:MAG: CHRD domain-containing protein [Vicinamibacterales bacterium]|nr:CHRD domain-containing protein [Vicinamibacterales bacterium]
MTDSTKIRSVSDGSARGWGPARIKKSLIVLLAVLAFVPLAAAEKYQVYLSPLPHNDETQPLIIGSKGTATATLDGDTITISGTFTGLSGRATKARLSLSRGPGIPGDAQFDLTLEGDTAGKVSGQKKLDASQLAALRSRKLYIQIDSEKMPSGHLWGWLLEEHEIAGEDVPVKGSGYLPPFAVRTK